jgi:hypothetical protein
VAEDNLMYPLHIVHDLRPTLPWTIYSLPFNIQDGSAVVAHEHRMAILWDEDEDERIHAALLDVYFRRPEALSSVYAVGEHKGGLTIWAAKFPTAHQSAWASASQGPAIHDAWPVTTVTAIAETMLTGGRRQMIETIGDDVIARKFSPEHDQLNLLIHLFELGPSGPRHSTRATAQAAR